MAFCNLLSHQEECDPCCQKERNEQIRDYDNTIKEYGEWTRVDTGVNGYRLPTEDQWKYAYQAQTTTAFSFGGDEELLDRYTVFVENARNRAAEGGRSCEKRRGGSMCTATCGSGARTGMMRAPTARAASWNNPATNCQSANRNRNQPDFRINDLGFRVAAVASGSK